MVGYPLVKPTDTDALVEFLAGDDWPFHPDPRPDPADVRRLAADGFYADGEDARTHWVTDAGRRVGLVRLFDLADPTPMFDVRIATPFRSRGYGRQAVEWLTRQVFEHHPLARRIEATTRQDNWPMRRALQHCAYVKESHYRQAWPAPGQAPFDAVGYAILRSDWQAGTTTVPDFYDTEG